MKNVGVQRLVLGYFAGGYFARTVRRFLSRNRSSNRRRNTFGSTPIGWPYRSRSRRNPRRAYLERLDAGRPLRTSVRARSSPASRPRSRTHHSASVPEKPVRAVHEDQHVNFSIRPFCVAGRRGRYFEYSERGMGTALRNARRRAGLCARCGVAAATGPSGPRSLCEKHLREAAEKTAKRVAAFRKAGACLDCGAATDDKTRTCSVCRGLRNMVREVVRERGRCADCRAVISNRRAFCDACQRRAREEREMAIKLGRCAWLCGRPALAGRTLCEEHWDPKRKKSPTRMCSRNCGRPAIPTRVLCSRCLKLRNRTREGRQKKLSRKSADAGRQE
jgi:hypothetical protein